MLPEISIDKLKAELRQLERLEKIKRDKSRREKDQYEHLMKLESFIKKFPDGKTQ